MSSVNDPVTRQGNWASRSRTFYSGTGADTVVAAGPGVLSYVAPNASQSGVAVVIYDAAVPSGATTITAGGPTAASGHTVLATIPANIHSPFLNTFQPIPVNVAFNSGLIVGGRSGQGSFTLGWTPMSGT